MMRFKPWLLEGPLCPEFWPSGRSQQPNLIFSFSFFYLSPFQNWHSWSSGFNNNDNECLGTWVCSAMAWAEWKSQKVSCTIFSRMAHNHHYKSSWRSKQFYILIFFHALCYRGVYTDAIPNAQGFYAVSLNFQSVLLFWWKCILHSFCPAFLIISSFSNLWFNIFTPNKIVDSFHYLHATSLGADMKMN